ncbi:GNAT family N-acetyltransferase [Nocardioides kribbensis]|uniref:GNAT family N-acetyltransferase n=1 Tax=Nocardioides kribbensis TaxID=305517 RepID=A0ABV1P416_9ACTN
MSEAAASGALTVVEVDPFDPGSFDPWHATYEAAQRHGHEELATPWRREELRLQLQGQVSGASRTRRASAYAGLVGGEVVATGWIGASLRDNLDTAEVEVGTSPAHRRRGHGSAVLEHLLGVARERGRSVVQARTWWPAGAPDHGAAEAGPAFLRRHRFELGLVEVLRTLELPVDPDRLAVLAEQAATHHPDHTLRSFVGPVPEELLRGWAEASARVESDAPTGDLDREPGTADPAGVREAEEVQRRQGRTRIGTVALDADGDVVAYTDLVTSSHEPGRAFQWGTLVRREHRGHRLGLAVKTANLRLLQSTDPSVRRVLTWNADANAPMVAVNDALGFRAAEGAGAFQRRLPRGDRPPSD